MVHLSKTTAALAVAATFLSASTPLVSAHGVLTNPAPTWYAGYAVNGFSATVPSSTLTVPAGGHFDWDPATNTRSYIEAFGNSTYTSLKQLILTNQVLGTGGGTSSKECGYTNPSGTAQVLPNALQWGNTFIHPVSLAIRSVWCSSAFVFPDMFCVDV